MLLPSEDLTSFLRRAAISSSILMYFQTDTFNRMATEFYPAQPGYFPPGASNGYYDPSQSSEYARHNFGAASLYVGDLSPSISEEVLSSLQVCYSHHLSQTLKEKFSEIGVVASVRIVTNRGPGGNQNYGYVNFENKDDGLISTCISKT